MGTAVRIYDRARPIRERPLPRRVTVHLDRPILPVLAARGAGGDPARARCVEASILHAPSPGQSRPHRHDGATPEPREPAIAATATPSKLRERRKLRDRRKLRERREQRGDSTSRREFRGRESTERFAVTCLNPEFLQKRR
ncbi:unnamed protein product [Closterium sp. NIES-65]|nr:unnamed protein product [Closterium sp. NIES-65]